MLPPVVRTDDLADEQELTSAAQGAVFPVGKADREVALLDDLLGHHSYRNRLRSRTREFCGFSAAGEGFAFFERDFGSERELLIHDGLILEKSGF
jgi:hypothetical protein